MTKDTAIFALFGHFGFIDFSPYPMRSLGKSYLSFHSQSLMEAILEGRSTGVDMSFLMLQKMGKMDCCCLKVGMRI